MTASATGRARSTRPVPAYIVRVEPAPSAPLLRVFVPGNAPSVNHMYVARHLTTEARAWRDAVALSLLPWRFPESAPRPDLRVSFVWVGMRSDIDNPCKLTLDGVKEGLAVDDKYVSELSLKKQKKTPQQERGAWIEVQVLPQPEQQQRQRQRRV